MESIAERLERKLTIHQKGLGHAVKTTVPEGWQPHDLMQLLKWEDGTLEEKK